MLQEIFLQKNFLEDLLYKNELKLDGKEVPKRIRGYDVALSEGKLNTIFYYDFFKYYTRNIMDFEQFEEGFYLKAQDLDDVWNIYQWENELDYRLAKRYEYDFLGEEGKTSHRIIWYDEEGNEKDIINCVMDYSYEKDRTIFSLFADDIMGVAAIKDENTGKEYGLYFGLGTLYKDGIGNLQILYEDGSIKEFSLEECIVAHLTQTSESKVQFLLNTIERLDSRSHIFSYATHLYGCLCQLQFL